jgi:hypothetical protein
MNLPPPLHSLFSFLQNFAPLRLGVRSFSASLREGCIELMADAAGRTNGSASFALPARARTSSRTTTRTIWWL